MSHFLQIDLENWDFNNNVERITRVLFIISGDWISEIQCDQIQQKERKFYDEVVYFGASVDDLRDGGPAEELNLLAMSDFHQFDG